MTPHREAAGLKNRVSARGDGGPSVRAFHDYFHRMAIIQALLSLLIRSAGKILNAIFGWAVQAAVAKGPKADAGTRPAVASALAGHPSAEQLSTPDLLKMVRQTQGPVMAQIDLTKAELRAELRAELSREGTMVAGLGAAAIPGIVAITLLFVTAALAPSSVVPAWVAGLCVSRFVLVVAGIAAGVGWSKRVKQPLVRTRHEFEEGVEFAKERVA